MKTSTLLLGLRAVVGYPVPFAAYGRRTLLFSNDPVGTRNPCATSGILVRQSGAHTKSGMCSAFDSLCPSHIYYLSPRTHLPQNTTKLTDKEMAPAITKLPPLWPLPNRLNKIMSAVGPTFLKPRPPDEFSPQVNGGIELKQFSSDNH